MPLKNGILFFGTDQEARSEVDPENRTRG